MKIKNSKNVKGTDSVSQRLTQLPLPLKANESDIKKIKNVFGQRLQVIWAPPSQWKRSSKHGPIPMIQDAFIDNTVVKEQVLHKIVEVKVWDKYKHKTSEKITDVESENDEDRQNDLLLDQAYRALVNQDVKYIKQILDEIMTRIQSLENGVQSLKAWVKN